MLMHTQAKLAEFDSKQVSLIEDLVDEINDYNYGQSALFESERPPPPEPNAVYVLALEKLSPSHAKENALSNLGYIPSWYETPLDYSSIYYVGRTGSPYERLEAHSKQSKRAAKIVKIHPPLALTSVEWFKKYEDAKDRELELADELRSDNVFVPYPQYD